MNFNFAEKVNALLERQDFDSAIILAESSLKKVDSTDFHNIIGKSLLSQSNNIVEWISKFYNTATEEVTVAALYFEFTEFDINQDVWEIDGFAYNQDFGFDDLEWLSNMAKVAEPFKVEGYEQIQNAFSDYNNAYRKIPADLEFARDWCEQLVIIRFAELMNNVHHVAKQKNLVWSSIPLYFTEHAYDFVMRSSAK